MGYDLYVLESCPKAHFEVRFEVLNLLDDQNNMSWKPLQYSLAMDSIFPQIQAIAIDEGRKRVYCKLVDYFRWTKFTWFVYDVAKNEWSDFGPDDEPTDLFFQNLMEIPDFYFSHILDGKTFIFDAPVRMEFEEKISRDSGDLVLYNLNSSEIEVVKKGLRCPIELGYQYFGYFVVQLRGGDICLVSFFPREEYPAPQISELIVHLIKSEEEEEPENKRKSSEQISSEPGMKKLKSVDLPIDYVSLPSAVITDISMEKTVVANKSRRWVLTKSRSYKMVSVPLSDIRSNSFQGLKDGYWPRNVQQLSHLTA